MKETTVEILNAKDWAKRIYGGVEGRVFLDLPEGFGARMTKALERSDDFERITQQAALSTSIQKTRKNRLLLESFAGRGVEKTAEIIEIEVLVNGTKVDLSGATVSNYSQDGEQGEYEFEMFADDWIDRLEAKQLKDVELGTFAYTNQGVRDAWAGDRQKLAMPVFADYGKFSTPGNVTRRDLRIWFNLGLLLKQAFCSVGWNLDCRHLEAGDGEYIYGYLSGENWASYEGKQTPFYTGLEITERQLLLTANEYPDWTIVSDVSNSWDVAGANQGQYGYFAPERPGRLRIQLTNFRVFLPKPVDPNQGAYTLYITLIKSGPETIGTEQFNGDADNDITRTINLEWIDEAANGADRYEVLFDYVNNFTGERSYFAIDSAELAFRPDPNYLVDNDDIPLAELIDPELTALELFQGVVHLMNGKAITDFSSRTVKLMPPYSYTAARTEEEIEGFYITDQPAIDLRDKTDPTFLEWENEEQDRKRFIKYEFASPDDELVKSLDEGLRFSRTVDLGSGKAETEKLPNPIFQPTYQRIISAATVGSTGAGPRLSALLDNLNGELTSEAGFRVAVYYGEFPQSTEGSQVNWQFENTTKVDVPYMAMVPGVQLPAGTPTIPISFQGFINDLYQRHYRREAEADSDPVSYVFKINGGNQTYELINFRRSLLVHSEESDHLIKPTAIKDYEWGSGAAVKVSAKTDRC